MPAHLFNRIFIAVIFVAFSLVLSCNDSEDPMGPEDDNEPPTVSITSPSADAEIAGEVTIEVSASDNNQVDSVQVLLDGSRVGVVTSSPFNFTWQSITVADSMDHELTARAFDSAQNSATSDPISLTVNAPVIQFASDVQPIFTNNCALSGCHAGSSPAGSMNLSEGNAYSNIVNTESQSYSPLERVVPFKPDSSVVYNKIIENPELSVGSRMPLSVDPLSEAQIAVVNFWIEQGAEDN